MGAISSVYYITSTVDHFVTTMFFAKLSLNSIRLWLALFPSFPATGTNPATHHTPNTAKYSKTLGIGLGLNQFYGLGLGLEAETQIISVSDSLSILRL